MVLMSQMLNTLKKDQKNFVTSQYKKKEKTFVPEFFPLTNFYLADKILSH